ncbi:Auxin responsive protein [Musa troglodytarum]|uniref:Auxin responsive protein n=1 Tax=Musa troglodytarum TaxID=320322 RepID=A0A9E7HSS7_9LILI|nr:Auxin responsive protein [Musa troglodytarum]
MGCIKAALQARELELQLHRVLRRRGRMFWRRKEKEAAAAYERLGRACDECVEDKVPRGHVPVLVGEEDGPVQRFVVNLRLFGDPCMAALLDLGAQRFGHHQQGVLRIPCDVDRFRRIIDAISKTR